MSQIRKNDQSPVPAIYEIPKENSFFFEFALPRFANSDRWFRDAAYLRA